MGFFSDIFDFDKPDYPKFPKFSKDEKRLLETRKGLLSDLLDVLSLGESGDKNVAGLLEEQLYNALAGETPTNAALEQDLAQQEKLLRETYSRKLGPDYENSTPWIQAYGEFQKRSEALRDSFRRRDMAETFNRLMGWKSGQTGLGTNLVSVTGAMMEPYRTQRLGEYGYKLQDAVGEYSNRLTNKGLLISATSPFAQMAGGMNWGGGGTTQTGLTAGGSAGAWTTATHDPEIYHALMY